MDGYAYNMSKTFFQGGESLPLVTGVVTRWI